MAACSHTCAGVRRARDLRRPQPISVHQRTTAHTHGHPKNPATKGVEKGVLEEFDAGARKRRARQALPQKPSSGEWALAKGPAPGAPGRIACGGPCGLGTPGSLASRPAPNRRVCSSSCPEAGIGPGRRTWRGEAPAGHCSPSRTGPRPQARRRRLLRDHASLSSARRNGRTDRRRVFGEMKQVLACHLPVIIKPGLQRSV